MNKYSRQGSHLFEYSAEQNAYVHVYQNARLTTLNALVNAYEESQLREMESDEFLGY